MTDSAEEMLFVSESFKTLLERIISDVTSDMMNEGSVNIVGEFFF